jgi:hypothetical protein
MPGYRKHRRPLAAWLILLLLFAQAATAAYACPQRDMLPAAHVPMPGCAESGSPLGMDAEHPLLCLADCEQNARAPSPSVADAPAAGVPLQVLAQIPAAPDLLSPLNPSTRPAARGDPPPGWPPPYLLNRVLRN